MSKLGNRRHRHDHFHQRAKQNGYAARSIYKLEEIDRRFGLFKVGLRILDLGSRPGSWLQFASKKIGKQGFIVGIDREPLEIDLPANANVLVGNVFEFDPRSYIEALPPEQKGKFHIVLSDMAPDTTGIPFTDQARSVELFLHALHLAEELGDTGSSFVGKIFMGEGFAEALDEAKRLYRSVKVVKPQATRSFSKEQFVVARQKKAL